MTSVRANNDGYTVATNQGDWHCQTLVLATGACNIPQVPALAAEDARDLSDHLASYLNNRSCVTRPKRQVLSR